MNDSKQDQTIQLDQFLKLRGVVQSGGEAKHLIQNGEVMVNGEVETRRGRKLESGDNIAVHKQHFVV